MLDLLRVALRQSRGARSALMACMLGCAGCGFHLQGSGTLPSAMARTFVDTKRPHSQFLLTLTDVLRQRGTEVLSAAETGAAVLDIASDDTGQRVLSVSARNTPREFEVYYAVTFSLQVDGQNVIDNETLVVTRSYTYDETQVLAKAAEEDVLRRALADDLARRVVRRIESLGASAVVPKS
jgi:LPS-assembly lipoprotein